jgi:hypothetical protein
VCGTTYYSRPHLVWMISSLGPAADCLDDLQVAVHAIIHDGLSKRFQVPALQKCRILVRNLLVDFFHLRNQGLCSLSDS